MTPSPSSTHPLLHPSTHTHNDHLPPHHTIPTRRLLPALLLLCALLLCAGPAFAGPDRETWIRATTKLTTNGPNTTGNPVDSLSRDNRIPMGNWYSDSTTTVEPFIQVELCPEGETWAVADNDNKDEYDIVIRIVRALSGDKNSNTIPRIQAQHPTAFEVQVSEDGASWLPLKGTASDHTMAYFVYRGWDTTEFSERLEADPKRRFRFMRLICKETLGNLRNEHGQLRVAMKTLQILKVKRGT